MHLSIAYLQAYKQPCGLVKCFPSALDVPILPFQSEQEQDAAGMNMGGTDASHFTTAFSKGLLWNSCQKLKLFSFAEKNTRLGQTCEFPLHRKAP